jgi:MFS family permease
LFQYVRFNHVSHIFYNLTVTAVSSLGLSLVSGFGGLLGFYIPEYAEHGADYADITALMTYPSMFMGVGCLTCMPLALSIGRRPVYLGSLVILVFGAFLAAEAKNYNFHLGARMVLGFAAGQSEALVPLMIQVENQRTSLERNGR